MTGGKVASKGTTEMSHRDRVIEFLQGVGYVGATNEEIVAHTGIKPHAQVFIITQGLMKQGRIKGIKSGHEWRFWLASGAKYPGETLNAQTSAARPPKGPTPAEFEKLALIAMSNVFGKRLSPARVPGVPKLFDCVSADHQIVGDAKFYTLVEGERLPPAKFSIIAEHVWLLEKAPAQRRFLVFGNDRRVPEEWLRRYGCLAEQVEFFFLDQSGVASRLETQRAFR